MTREIAVEPARLPLRFFLSGNIRASGCKDTSAKNLCWKTRNTRDAIAATQKKATRSSHSYTQMDDGRLVVLLAVVSTPRKKGLVVLLPVVLKTNGKVLHRDALLADRPPAVPRDLYERVERDLDLRGITSFATDEIRIEHA